MLSVPNTLRSYRSLPQRFRNNYQISPNQEDARITTPVIYSFRGEVTSLDNTIWFLTHPQDRSEQFIATFAGLATGDILDVEDIDLKTVGKKRFIWKMQGKLGR